MAVAGGLRVAKPGADAGEYEIPEGAMNFAHPHFAEPHWLWVAALAPLTLLALQWYSGWARREQLARIAAPQFLVELTRSHSPWRRAVKNLLMVAAVAGIGLALAR